MNRLAHHQGIYKFFFTLGLTLQLSKPVLKHLVHIVDALTTKGFSGTLTDVHHCYDAAKQDIPIDVIKKQLHVA
ncbi:hypothetical protein B9L19_00195 [Geobacillus thermocatenulatus]|uniref:Uncharacterized protein n=1 Tax=Geobacillus thermocatenulatus TaxID=33938 RepID=A0AA91TDR4_9BACL|nr:hypothetical protein B9L19_00195 [Geobacillus thermocatenulatus]